MYERLWPVDDLVRCRLKYQKTVLKKKETDNIVASARAEARRKQQELFLDTLAQQGAELPLTKETIKPPQTQTGGRDGAGNHPQPIRKSKRRK